MKLGKLEKVELRNLWNSESSDFTPWLAKEENIALLSEAIGIELELVNQEKSVGQFRADILCKDTLKNHYVLIENQLERTDHTHLGQIITYAAGLDAVTIIWIAKEFNEEHRSAVDWLNRISDDNINFFGVEIQAYKIGDSIPAPMFDIVAKPNDWLKSIKNRIDTQELNDTDKLKIEYWSGLRDYLISSNSFLRPQKPLPQHWTNFALGKSSFHMSAAIATQKKIIRVEFDMENDIDKNIISSLQELYEEQSKTEIDENIVWQRLNGKKMSWVYLSKEANVNNKDEWPEQFEWFKTYLEKFDKFFRPKIKSL